MLGSRSTGNISLVSRLYTRKVSLISIPIWGGMCIPCQLWCGVPSHSEVLQRSQLARSWCIACQSPSFTKAASGLQVASAKG